MSAAGTAYYVDALRVHRKIIQHIIDRVLDIGEHQLRAAGLRPGIRAAEVRVNQVPIASLAVPMVFLGPVFIVAAPGMQSQQQRPRLGTDSESLHGRQQALISTAKIAYLLEF